MPCILRITSTEEFSSLPKGLGIRPYRIEGNDLHFDISAADFDNLSGQITDAITFLDRHDADLRTLLQLGEGVLDFGYEPRNTAAVQVDRLPLELLRSTAQLGLEIELYLLDSPVEDLSQENAV